MNLPSGWNISDLQTITDINPGHGRRIDDDLPVTFVPMPALSETNPDFKYTESRPYGSVKTGYTKFAEGDVLFAKITPCMENGKGAVARNLDNELGCGTTELFVLRPKRGISPNYVYRFLAQEKIRKQAKGNFTGTAGQARVPKAFIESIEIPIPPLNEQKRIVEKLEKLLGRVEAVQARLDKIPAILKRFRQSVLAAACSGKLTADWRREESLGEQLGNVEIPNSWKCEKLPDLGFLGRGRSRHRPRDAEHLYGGPYPFIQTGAVARAGGRITQHTQTYSEAGLAQSKLWETGTVCITIAANIADSAILTYPACFPDSVVGFVADPEKCVTEFVEFFIRTARSDLSNFAPATAQKNINLSILNEVLVTTPPVEEQKEIVRRVEELFAFADTVEERYTRARAHTDKLTESILAKAFRGELVPQDPNDEPAYALLEKLNTEPR